MVKYSLCATCYNEVDDLDGSVAKLCEMLPEDDWEFVVVDGGSDDGTIERLRELAATHGQLRVAVDDDANIGEGRQRTAALADGDVHAQISDVDSEWYADGRLVDVAEFYDGLDEEVVLKGKGAWFYTPSVLDDIGGWRPFRVAEERDLERRALRHGKMRFCDVRLRGEDTNVKTLFQRTKRSFWNAKVKLSTGVSLIWMMYVWLTKPEGILPKIAALTIFPLARIAAALEECPHWTYDRRDEFVFRIGEVVRQRYPDLWLDRPAGWPYERWKHIDSQR